MPCKGKGTCCMFIGVKTQQSKSCPSHMRHAYLTWYMSLPKLSSVLHVARLLVLIYASTKYYQTIQAMKKSLSAQEFGLEIYSVECRKKKRKKKTTRVGLLTCDTPTWPDICPTKNYLRQHGIYSLHKISAPGEISTNKFERYLLVLIYASTKYY